MGMESFYFNITCDKYITKKSILGCISTVGNIEQYYTYSNCLFIKKKIIDYERYIMCDSLILEITTNDEETNVSIEACFSNYNNNIKNSFTNI